jgi:hypothetical protein
MSLIDPDATVKLPRIRGDLKRVHVIESPQSMHTEITDKLAQRNDIERIQTKPLSTLENADHLMQRGGVERVPENTEKGSSIQKQEQQNRVRNTTLRRSRRKSLSEVFSEDAYQFYIR